MSEITWGVPVQRKTKEEKFTTPVVTMAAIEKGKGRKFSFNKAAQELLGLKGGESHISFGFLGESIVIMSSNTETGNSFPLTKQFSISNGKTAAYIAKVSNLNTDIENYLHLRDVDDQPYAEVSHISNDNAPETQEEEGKSEEVEVMEMAEKPAPENEDDAAEELASEKAREGVDINASTEEVEGIDVEESVENEATDWD